MKRITLIVFFVAIFFVAKSQDENKMIRYYFGHTIDTVLRIAIDSNMLEIEESESYVLTCSSWDTIRYISLYIYCSTCDIYDSIGDIKYWRRYLSENSNRYYLINGMKIPIIFSDFDEKYGVIKMLDEEKGSYRKSFRLFGEFESKISIETNRRGDKFFGDVKYIKKGNKL